MGILKAFMGLLAFLLLIQPQILILESYHLIVVKNQVSDICYNYRQTCMYEGGLSSSEKKEMEKELEELGLKSIELDEIPLQGQMSYGNKYDFRLTYEINYTGLKGLFSRQAKTRQVTYDLPFFYNRLVN